MSTLQAPGRTTLPAGQGPRTPWSGLLLAEWTKIRSVRSTVWSLAAFVVVAIGLCTLIALVVANQWNKPGPHPEHATILADPTGAIYGAGFDLGQLALAVLGVIVITSEYSSGAIRSSLLAVPRRIPMLVAKVVVFGALVLVVGAVTVFAVFFIATTIYHPDFVVTLGQPGVLRATIGGILYLTVLGLFAMAIGGLIRHTAGAIATVIGLILVVPILVSLIPGTIAAHVKAYLPTDAGQLVGQTTQQSGDLLSPWQGFGVFCLWTVVLLIATGWLLRQRDA
ncbi:MAG TPA: ABC transporter permease subunit [Trebonia sp.]|nr:ABC transporter permease subunit [Trebonia sp.]